MATHLIAGVGRDHITPPVGVDLCGFGGRKGPSTDVHDDLRACALYLSDGSRELAIITADLIGLHHGEVAEIRADIQRQTGIPPQAVMIACSHTHGGPATKCLNYLGQHDEAYLAGLKRRLAGLAVSAKRSAQPAQAGAGRQQPVSIGTNRRAVRDGRMVLGENPTGPTAPYADALCVDDLDGKPMARLFCHASHAVTLGGDNRLITGDWPGYAQRETERLTGGNCVAMFMQGCCGNINSHPRGDFDIAAQHGRTMAEAALQAAAAAPRRSDPVLRAVSSPVELPLMPPPPLDEAEALYRRMQAEAEKAQEAGSYGTKRMQAGIARWAAGILELAKAPPQERTVPFEVQALRVGDMAIVGLPGEVFVEYALNIDAASPFSITAVSAYTNGNIGYVPTAKAYDEGGYEVDNAIRYYGSTMQKPESEGIILKAAADVLAEIA